MDGSGVPPSKRTRTLAERTPGPGDLEPIETAPRADLEALQLERLQDTVRRAHRHIDLYRQRFEEAGLTPESLGSLDDLRRFPFTTKDDLRSTYPFGMVAVPPDQVRRIHASSGTTGHPTVVASTAADLETWAALVARSIRAAGGRPGDRVHVAYGYGLFTGGLGAHYGAERLGCTVIPASGGMSERQVRLIADLRPEVIMVTPSYMLALLDEMQRQGVDPASTSLRIGIFGAEPWTDEMRAEIEERLDIHAVDIYGLSEVMGPGVANECLETKDGLHIWEDHFLPEVIDPHTGEVLPDGERGELVLTTLTRQAQPLVRYRTRDLTRLLPGTARAMRRLERITGRTDDMVILRGVNLFPSQVEELVLRVDGLSPHFELLLRRPQHLDEMTVRVEARDPADDADARAVLARRLAASIKSAIGVSTAVEVVDPGAVERSSGKARRVRDLRGG